jgi:signal transduction histidine kinase
MSAINLLDQPMTPSDWEEIGAIIQRGYRRLDAFIAAGLDYFGWCGMGPAETEEVTDWTRIVAGDHVGTLVPAGCSPGLSTPRQVCPVRMSEANAVSILRVLVENAVKFSLGAPEIEIVLTAGADRMRLAVRDKGRGFDPGIGPELFRPFTVMDTLHHREGTGLNLARTAAMVEAHGGRIEAQSEGLGRGATFIVELPLHRADDSHLTQDRRAA